VAISASSHWGNDFNLVAIAQAVLAVLGAGNKLGVHRSSIRRLGLNHGNCVIECGRFVQLIGLAVDQYFQASVLDTKRQLDGQGRIGALHQAQDHIQQRWRDHEAMTVQPIDL